MPHVNKLFKSAKIYGQISEQHRTINLVSERLNVQNKNELKDLKVKEEQRFLLRRACPVDRQAPAGSPRGGKAEPLFGSSASAPIQARKSIFGLKR